MAISIVPRRGAAPVGLHVRTRLRVSVRASVRARANIWCVRMCVLACVRARRFYVCVLCTGYSVVAWAMQRASGVPMGPHLLLGMEMALFGQALMWREWCTPLCHLRRNLQLLHVAVVGYALHGCKLHGCMMHVAPCMQRAAPRTKVLHAC